MSNDEVDKMLYDSQAPEEVTEVKLEFAKGDAVNVKDGPFMGYEGTVDDIFYRSSHPYTLGLKEAMPSNTDDRDKSLSPILGSPPDLFKPPVGCGYCARCPYAMSVCAEHLPPATTISESHEARCWLHHPTAPDIEELHQLDDQNAG